MQKALKFAAKWIVIAEILLVLLPLTVGMFLLVAIGLMSLSAIIFGSDNLPNMEVSIGYLLIATLEVLACYGLFALWWLAFNYAKISIRNIPRYVLFGLMVGVTINILIIAAPLISGLVFPVGRFPPISFSGFVFYIGPLITLSTLTLLMWLQNKSSVHSNIDSE